MSSATPQQKCIRAEEIREFLLKLPLADHSPLKYDLLVEELSILQKILHKLKAFVHFLSKLNPAQYFGWMEEAFLGVHLNKNNSEEKSEFSEWVDQQTHDPIYQSEHFLSNEIEIKSKKTKPI